MRRAIIFLLLILACAPMLSAQISGAAPQLRLRETDQVLPAGYWRLELQDDVIRIEKNTNAAGSFATYNTYLHNFHHPTGGGAVPDGQNFFIGQDAGNYTGGATATATSESSYNIGIGRYAMNHFTLASYSVALGNNALRYVTTGNANTALGFSALTNVTQGYNNVAVGTDALYTNLIGNSNIALGYYAGAYETGSSKLFINNQDRTNTAGDTGKSLIYGIMAADPVNQVLNINGKVKIDTSGTYGAPNEQLELTGNIRIPQTTATTGIIKTGTSTFIHNFKHPTGGGAVPAGNNFFAGDSAGNLTMGATATSAVQSSYNTGLGVLSLNANTKGYGNSATGFWSMKLNTEGYYDTASGYAALYTNTTGNTNTALGAYSLFDNSTGSGNIGLGYNAGAHETGSNALYIDNQDRTNTAGDKAGAIIYGVMAAAAANQRLQINATTGIGVAATATEQLLLTPNAAGIKGIVIKGAAAQTANLLELQDSGAGVLSAVKSDGTFYMYSTAARGTMPGVSKYTVSYTDAAFKVASTTATVTLFTLPQYAKIIGVTVKHSAQFSDGAGAMTAVTVSAGVAGSTTAYSAAWGIGETVAVADTTFQDTAQHKSTTMAAAGADVIATFLATDRNFGDGGATFLTGGSVDIYVHWVSVQ